MTIPHKRIFRLEACRGIAAIIVVASHSLMAFKPPVVAALWHTPFYIFINGGAAVMFFFTLSGYVLTARFFLDPRPNDIVAAIIKRLPRLAVLTTIATVASALLWRSGAYRFEDAGALSGSDWLKSQATLGHPQNYRPDLFEAFKQGAWDVFFTGDCYLDNVLWTMLHEFRGSLVVFILAPFLVYVVGSRWIALPLLVIAAVVFLYADPFMIPFLCGMTVAYLALYLPQSRFVLAIFFVAAIALLDFDSVSPTVPVILRNAFGASLLIAVVLRSTAAVTVLENRLGVVLGYLSFPIYVVHVPVIFAAGTFVYLKGSATAAIAVSVIVTLVLAWPLAALDRAWVKALNALRPERQRLKTG